MKSKQVRAGFTLVELSIVLVIIGLLIGGILVAQSMISTVRIQSFVRKIGQVDAAVQNFGTKYNSLPGDSKVFPNPGNGDGYITDADSSLGIADFHYSYEIMTFWSHLQLSGFVESGVSSYSAVLGASGFDYSSATRNAPQAGVGTNTSIVPFSYYQNDTDYGTNYAISDFSTVNPSGDLSSSLFKGGIKSIDAVAVDKKMDDGSGLSGDVQLLDAHGSLPASHVAVDYDLTSSAENLSLKIKLLRNSRSAN